MLKFLNIKNIVLIENLSIDFEDGLTVLTGETGAGKSILLDALGLTLGSRADFSLIRHGETKATVSAVFSLNIGHSVWELLEPVGIEKNLELILRRHLTHDGKSTATINDIPVSINLLRKCGDILVEIQGQFEGRGLLDKNNHILLLDKYANHNEELIKLKNVWNDYNNLKLELNELKVKSDNNLENEEWFKDQITEFEKINPKNNEEDQLLRDRQFFLNTAKISEAIKKADLLISKDEGIITLIGRIQSILEKDDQFSGGNFAPIIDSLSKANLELTEAELQIRKIKSSIGQNSNKLEQIDERLFEIRNLARKHKVKTDELEKIKDLLEEKLSKIQNKSKIIKESEKNCILLRDKFSNIASKVSLNRKNTGAKLDLRVKEELLPLKLDGATFRTSFEKIDETKWSKFGWDKIQFEVSTIPGSDCGPIEKISSGGELSRFLLALKVIFTNEENFKTVIFDEVDSGIGGAVASAVGKRLQKLGNSMQTLVITHSPQVASKGKSHIKIFKVKNDKGVESKTIKLNFDQKVEEIARMLSADNISEQARAAALKLIKEE